MFSEREREREREKERETLYRAGRTAMIYAAERGHVEVLDRLASDQAATVVA